MNATSTIAGTFTYTPALGAILPAGAQTLSATFTPTDTADYSPQTVTATLTVNKATLTLTAANASRPYNTPNPTFTGTLSGAVNGDTFTESFATTATIASVAGTYPITPKRNGHEPRQLHRQRHERHPHHHPGLNQLHHHLDPRFAHLRDRPRRCPVERHFHHRRHLHLHASPRCDPARRRPDPLRHLHPNRYRRLLAPTVTATLTVNKATLTLTAANASRPYNTPNPTFTGTLTGAVNGDTFTESFATTATIASVAGTYPITPSATGTNLANYTVSATNGTLTITPASTSSTITWTPASLTYGTGLGAAQLNATSTIAGTFTYTPALGAILPAGAQTLSATFTPTDTADYAPQTVTATLTVNKATLTLTAANASRPYNTPNPTFTGTLSGAVNGDTFTESFATTATIASVAGTYPITPSATGTNLANYTVSATNGTLTITPASTSSTITWTPAALTYGTGLGAAQLNATSTIAGTFTYTPVAGAILPAGAQTLSATFTPTDTADYPPRPSPPPSRSIRPPSP